MFKSSILILAVVAATVSAYTPTYQLQFTNNAGRSNVFGLDKGVRLCYCMSKTQTASIKGINGGDIKLFSRSDCTGNYVQLGSNSVQNNAQWVNSVSFGASGIPSDGPTGCIDWY